MGEMNIVGNNCVSARIYQGLKIQFNNPFMWISIPNEDFVYLINHFDEIDFSKFKLSKSDFFYITIDDKVKLRFIHHFQDPNYHIPTKLIKGHGDGNGIYYERMDKYLIDCYKKRVKRMKEDPIFLINDKKSTVNSNYYTFDDINLLKKIHTKYPVIYCGKNDPKIPGIEYIETGNWATADIAKTVLEKSNIIHE